MVWSKIKVCIIASLSGAGITLLVLYFQGKGPDAKKDDNDDDDDDDTNGDGTQAFPWEPKSNQPRPYSFRETTATVKNRGQEQKELDFLSSMTFANGGLRAPNCLCCL